MSACGIIYLRPSYQRGFEVPPVCWSPQPRGEHGGHLTPTNAGSRRPLILDSCPSFPALSGTSSQEQAAALPVLELAAEDALFCNPHAPLCGCLNSS